MKKLTLGVLLVSAIAILIGCHTPLSVREEALLPMAQSYRGVLPCADCAGIDTVLFLETNGIFILQQQYQAVRPGNTIFASYGKWARTADKLILTDTQGEKYYFRPQDMGLLVLDRSGDPITSSQPYRLLPTQATLPTTPMVMRGMYRYFADTARFVDCFTGKNYPVLNNVALEKHYLQLRTAPEEDVLLTLSAHYAVMPSMEAGQKEKSIVPSDAAFDMKPNQRCGD